MPNINISSGSDFSKKKFGSVVKLTKPAFVHNGKIFSDHIFNNQKTIPYYKNEAYYVAHGLPDDFSLLNNAIPFSFGSNNEIQNFIQTQYNILNNPPSNPVENRSFSANTTTSNISSILDPYDDNEPPECTIP